MARRRIQEEILTNAEKQRRYRAKQKATTKALKANLDSIKEVAALEKAKIRESIEKELQEKWELVLKAERIAAKQKARREDARQKDKSFENGYIKGICISAAYLAKRCMADKARDILDHFRINREHAADVLESDKRTKNSAFVTLDQFKAWPK